jgi:hypothetical protein
MLSPHPLHRTAKSQSRHCGRFQRENSIGEYKARICTSMELQPNKGVIDVFRTSRTMETYFISPWVIPLNTFPVDRRELWPSLTGKSNVWIVVLTSCSAQVNRAFSMKTALLMNLSGVRRASGNVREKHPSHAPVAKLRHPFHSNPPKKGLYCADHVFRRRVRFW